MRVIPLHSEGHPVKQMDTPRAGNNEIANPVILYLNDDGSVTGRESSGEWSVTDGKPYMSVTIDGTEYKGIFCPMKDEAGTDVMTFSAVGANTTVWGVKYAAD